MRRSKFALSVAIVTIAISGAACSSDGGSSSKSKQDAVCTDANTLKASVTKVIDDVKSGNFGNAKDQIATVKSDFAALESSAKSLAADKKSSVQSDLDSVKSTLGELSSASSADDIKNTLTDAESQLKDAADSITKTLSC